MWWVWSVWPDLHSITHAEFWEEKMKRNRECFLASTFCLIHYELLDNLLSRLSTKTGWISRWVMGACIFESSYWCENWKHLHSMWTYFRIIVLARNWKHLQHVDIFLNHLVGAKTENISACGHIFELSYWRENWKHLQQLDIFFLNFTFFQLYTLERNKTFSLLFG